MTFLGITSGLFWTLLASLGAALAVMYLFRLRRRRVEVPYGALWRRVLAQRQTRSLWHRLKRWLSLLLQWVVLSLILLALRDPRPSDFEVDARHVVLVVDSSASMATKDLPGGRDRMEAAREAALAVFDGLSAEDQVMILRMDGEVRPLTDFGRPTAIARQRLVELRVTATSAELPATLRFAARALAGRSRPELVLISDAAFDEQALGEAAEVDWPSGTRVRVVPVGEAVGNVGITAFNARRYPLDRRNFEVFVQVASTFESPITVELTLRAGGRAVDQRFLEVPPGGSVERFYANLARGHRRLEAHIEVVGSDNNDLFELDNAAFALLPRDRALSVLLVSEPNLFVEAPLLLNPNVEATPWRSGPQAPPTPEQMAAYDVVVTNGEVPPLPERGNFLVINPSGPHSPFAIRGVADDPIIDRVVAGDPLLRYVGGLDDLNIRRASRLQLESGDRAVARSIRGDAMIARRSTEDRRVVAIAFPIEASDFGLRLAYPLVVLNAIDWLTSDEAALIDGLRTGRAARVFVPEPGVSAAWVRAPTGALQRFEVVDRYVPVYPDWPGYYEIFWESEALAATDSEALGRAIAEGAAEPDQVVAANLKEPAERRIAPATDLPFETAPPPDAVERAGLLAGREPWTVLVLVALAVLLVEWWTYNRRMTV